MMSQKEKQFYDTFSSSEDHDNSFANDHLIQDTDLSKKDNSQFLALSKTIGLAILVGFFVLFGSLSIQSASSLQKETSESTIVGGKSLIAVENSITSSESKSKSKPNFIFILADDLGYNSIGYTEYDLETVSPYLTSLAKKGIVMSNYYAQEICTPSRASLLTGRYPISLGMQYEELQPDQEWGLNVSETILPEILRDVSGYKTYAIGKWNLGHYLPEMLPTARGFDHFIGFLNGQNYYWSKKYPLEPQYTDFMYADSDCYSAYNSSDLGTYSTFLYRDKAVQAIAAHDFSANPLFMYLAVQAVHDPFDDSDPQFSAGIPASYLDEDMYEYITGSIPGLNRQQYAMALNLLDSSVQTVVEALAAKGQMQNTYVIFASDNGGCYQAGGRNGDLRGSKGSLFEGGLKVDSFIYSALLPDSARGSVYSGIMHVSDWFPTILELSGSSGFVPAEGFLLDGVSHASALQSSKSPCPRQYLLYNMYFNVAGEAFDVDTNAPVAIRDSRYKLLHAYTNNTQAEWYSVSEVLDDDASLFSVTSCPQFQTLTGEYTKFLFDLQEDPNETNNLYLDKNYDAVKANLYLQLEQLQLRVKLDSAQSSAIASSSKAHDQWRKVGNYIMPWYSSEQSVSGQSSSFGTEGVPGYPGHCIPMDSVFG